MEHGKRKVLEILGCAHRRMKKVLAVVPKEA